MVDEIFEEKSNLDVSDQLLHVRALVASAKAYQCEAQFAEAIQGWNTALSRAQLYKSFRGEGFTYAVIHLSLSLAYAGINDLKATETSFKCAEQILLRSKRDYWISTLALWADHTSKKLESLTGWSVNILNC